MLIKNINELLENHVYYGQGYGKECICCIATIGKDGYLWMKHYPSHDYEKYYDCIGFKYIGEFPDDLPKYSFESYDKNDNSNIEINKPQVLTIHDIDSRADKIYKSKDKTKPKNKKQTKLKNNTKR